MPQVKRRKAETTWLEEWLATLHLQKYVDSIRALDPSRPEDFALLTHGEMLDMVKELDLPLFAGKRLIAGVEKMKNLD